MPIETPAGNRPGAGAEQLAERLVRAGAPRDPTRPSRARPSPSDGRAPGARAARRSRRALERPAEHGRHEVLRQHVPGRRRRSRSCRTDRRRRRIRPSRPRRRRGARRARTRAPSMRPKLVSNGRTSGQSHDGEVNRADAHRIKGYTSPCSVRSCSLPQLYSPTLDFRYLAIEGPIGLGKSALAERLGARLDATVVLDEAGQSVSRRFLRRPAGRRVSGPALLHARPAPAAAAACARATSSARPRSATISSSATASTRS